MASKAETCTPPPPKPPPPTPKTYAIHLFIRLLCKLGPCSADDKADYALEHGNFPNLCILFFSQTKNSESKSLGKKPLKVLQKRTCSFYIRYTKTILILTEGWEASLAWTTVSTERFFNCYAANSVAQNRRKVIDLMPKLTIMLFPGRLTRLFHWNCEKWGVTKFGKIRKIEFQILLASTGSNVLLGRGSENASMNIMA